MVREGFTLPPLIEGGAQERGLRAGTENVAGAVGMAAALADAVDHLEKRQARVAAYRDDLAAHITSLPDVRLTGAIDDAHRLPSIASFVCKDVDGELLVVLLDRAGVAAATGSACSTGSTDPSHVITALGITDPRWTRGSLRLSLADDVSAEDVEALKERVASAITRAAAHERHCRWQHRITRAIAPPTPDTSPYVRSPAPRYNKRAPPKGRPSESPAMR